jgi:hypothetical protein
VRCRQVKEIKVRPKHIPDDGVITGIKFCFLYGDKRHPMFFDKLPYHIWLQLGPAAPAEQLQPSRTAPLKAECSLFLEMEMNSNAPLPLFLKQSSK